MSKMFRRFFTRARDVKKGFRNVWKPRKHLADNPPESCGRWGWIVRSLPGHRVVRWSRIVRSIPEDRTVKAGGSNGQGRRIERSRPEDRPSAGRLYRFRLPTIY